MFVTASVVMLWRDCCFPAVLLLLQMLTFSFYRSAVLHLPPAHPHRSGHCWSSHLLPERSGKTSALICLFSLLFSFPFFLNFTSLEFVPLCLQYVFPLLTLCPNFICFNLLIHIFPATLPLARTSWGLLGICASPPHSCDWLHLGLG